MGLPNGYIIGQGGYYKQDDNSGPYSFDGTAMTLIGALNTVQAVSASFASPAGAKSYIPGDMISSNGTPATINADTSASSGIMALTAGRSPGKGGMVRRVRVKTTDTAFAGKTVRVRLYKDRPVVQSGSGDDNPYSTNEATYLGKFDVTLDETFSDYVKGIAVPYTGSEVNFEPVAGSQVIYAVLECRDTVTGGTSKTWFVTLEVIQD